jgi:hypothetical protein
MQSNILTGKLRFTYRSFITPWHPWEKHHVISVPLQTGVWKYIKLYCALFNIELSYSSSTDSYYEKSGKRIANFAFKISHHCRKVAAKKMTKTCWHAFNKPRENRHWNNKKFWKVAKYENCQKNSQGLLVIYIQTSLPLLCFCRRQHYSGHPNQLLFSKTAKNKGILIFHVKDN